MFNYYLAIFELKHKTSKILFQGPLLNRNSWYAALTRERYRRSLFSRRHV